MKKSLIGIGVVTLASMVLVGCSNGGSQEAKDGKETITFINHRTDWEASGKWDEYIKKFNEKNPDIKVEIQTITDYAGQVKTRMNSDDYGDLLMIPGDIKAQDYANFFDPLGQKSELSEKYLSLNDRSYEGVSYGIPSQLNATGMVVNMKVFEDAGIKEFPKTPEDFVKALKTIKEKNPEVTPLYTNYASGWTLSNWDFVKAGVAGDMDYSFKMTSDKSPFYPGKPLNISYNLLYTVTKDKLVESDPTTSDWEQSKVDLANGKIAVMVLGSWAVPQVQQANPDNAKNIQFQAFPTTAADGKQYMTAAGDYNYGINVHSKHKEAARKLLDWLVNESDYAKDNGGIPTLKGAEYPDSLKSSQKAGVQIVEENPAPKGKESLFSDLNNESQLGIGTTDKEKQRIIDAALGNSKESFEDIMKDFNQRWSDAISKIATN